MRNKNLFTVLLVIFGLICLYNLVMTGIRLGIDSELESLQGEQRDEYLKQNYDLYQTAINNSFSLGLDLKGGMFVTMEIGVDDILEALAGRNKDSVFVRAMTRARALQKNSQDNFVDLFARSLKEINPQAKLASYFGGQALGVSIIAQDQEVIDKLKEEINTVVDNSYTILRNRIDQFGVVSPNVQKVEGTGRILVELPGVNDPKRVRQLLRSTAKLEFWPTYTYREVVPILSRINDKVNEQKILAGGTPSSDQQIENLPASQTETAADTSLASSDTTAKKSTADDVLGKQKAADTAGLTQDQKVEKFKKENPFFALLSPPDPNTINENTPEIGYAIVTDTAKVNKILNNPEIQRIIPGDLVFLWTAKPKDEQKQIFSLISIRSNRDRIAPLGGETVTDARPEVDPNTKQNTISMTMNAEGARIWKNITENNIGKSVAIVLDNLVYSYPVVQTAITGGRSSISGQFTYEEAKDLSSILKAGKLPAPARIIAEEQVGPSLGADTIQAGMIAFFLGFLATVAFVLLYYGRAGTIAAIALVINLFMLAGVCAALNVVLTLPGIAGIVLTLGMAVDANVLIYERIREELLDGKSLKGSIAEGFRNAFSAIIDGNITTFLTGFVLFSFGTGPIKGFAVTLMIGIITTLVTGLIVTRLLLDNLANKPNVKITFGSQAAVKYFEAKNFSFISGRKRNFVAFIVLTLAFVGCIAVIGFRLGVDFSGGRQYTVEFQQPIQTSQLDAIRRDLTQAFEGKSPVVKTVSNSRQLMVTTSYLIDEPDSDNRVDEALLRGLGTSMGASKPEIIRSSNVGPTIARDIKESAIKSIIFALLIMFGYIFFRFSRWQFGLAALASLTFNVIVVLGIFSLFGFLDVLPFSMEIDQAFIAAILTIVGYTINDTVIIFDRIRERIKANRGNRSYSDLFYTAIKETLSRTLVTSITTLITAFMLFFFAGEVLRSFMFAIILGIIVGTLSSIFLAAPLSLDLILKYESKTREKENLLAGTTV